MHRTRIGILFGGRSEEHPVSVKSAREVAAHLDLDRYEPFFVGITGSGTWRLCDGPDEGWEERGRLVVLSPDPSVHGLLVADGNRFEAARLDVVLPVLHGRYGEDGSVQGLLELAGVPYVGCDVASSALCMDKSLTYLVARSAGVATPAFRSLLPTEALDPAELSYPVFVKPARSGSSFGVTKVERADELPGAVDVARRYDTKVLVEEAIVADEVGCAVLGNGDDLFVGEVDRITLSCGFFRIHQEASPESGSENSTITVPANIPSESRRLVQETAKVVYRALGCRGLARVDLFLTADGRIVLNEVNTLPGLTSYSRYPAMMAAAGLTLGDVLDRLVALATGPQVRVAGG
ncbi:D-alanine--(R)-lactate ligase [Pseudonocardia xishanensis]|uniref:D-alanine--D-alanine ligase n=1 Tax=Pseudonocardia xishanensis TaxID=630995 RepID=A0ABP8RIL5_9PSEU